MDDVWYVRRRKTIEGPFPRSELRQAALSGHVTPETLVSQSQASGWVAAKRIGDLKFGTTIELSSPRSRPPAETKSPRSFRGRKTGAVLGVIGTALAVLAIALAISRREERTPLADENKATVAERAATESAKSAISGKTATKSSPSGLITQRWQRKWLQQH
jgi:hypothetical protein